jgi:hypothetical protein
MDPLLTKNLGGTLALDYGVRAASLGRIYAITASIDPT